MFRTLQRRLAPVLVLRPVPRLRALYALRIDSGPCILSVHEPLLYCRRLSSSDADIVCSRAKNHYDPQGTVDFSDSATQVDDAQATSSLEAFRRGFKPLHQSQSTLMYFS